MRIVALGDIHGALPEIPECDVVVIAGDIVPLDVENDGEASAKWLTESFASWCRNLACRRVIFIPGNHDRLLEALVRDYTLEEIHHGLFADDTEGKIVMLVDCGYEFEGVSFYGTPWCPDLVNWAFYADDEQRRVRFDAIANCDVLITHCPPRVGTQGVVLGQCRVQGSNFGDPVLADVLHTKSIKWVLSGHIHSGNHSVEQLGTIRCRNCSLKDEHYKIAYEPFVFEV